MHRQVELRFYAALNDFLPTEKRQRSYLFPLTRETSIKDLIESQGVPHTEVALILVNGKAVGFDHRVGDNERIAVYPVFANIDFAPETRLREALPQVTRFVLDCHLGRLARYLRQFGFDTLYQNNYHDAELAGICAQQQRILLTRDRTLLMRKIINHGYFVRATSPLRQFHEVMRRFGLYDQIVPFGRCTRCNGEVVAVNKTDVLDQLEPGTIRHYEQFWQCSSCGQVYWEGSHYQRMQHTTNDVIAVASDYANNG